jgi:hypothetical protein
MQRLNVSRNDSYDPRTQSPFVRRYVTKLILQPKSLQRIAATLAEESAPTEVEMKREGMLYRYLRDYTPSSPIASPLDVNPYDIDADDDAVDTQPWWGETTMTPNARRESSPSVDPMDTSTTPQQPSTVVPISIPEARSRRQSVNMSDFIHMSPTNAPTSSMPPPMVPQLARMKRKGISLNASA